MRAAGLKAAGGRLALDRRHDGRGHPRQLPTQPSEVLQVAPRGDDQAREVGGLPRVHARSSSGPTSARRLGVRANADTPHDAASRALFGAEGIGLCRTEHMFFEEKRICAVREMILAETLEPAAGGARQAPADAARGLRRDLPRDGRPARHDPPARPAAARVPAARRRDDAARSAARARRSRSRRSASATHALKEANPMLGHRGCRLGITYPEIYEMQVRAIFEAAARRREGRRRRPARDHDPARRRARRVRAPARARRRGGRRGHRRDRAGRSPYQSAR